VAVLLLAEELKHPRPRQPGGKRGGLPVRARRSSLSRQATAPGSSRETWAAARRAPVSLRIDYDERAISQAAAFPGDPHGIRAVLDAIDRLACDPRPVGSFPYGSPGLRRLRVAGTGSCMKSPKTRWRSGTSPALSPRADRRASPGTSPGTRAALHGFAGTARHSVQVMILHVL
jgi:hypothetical protein